MHAPRAHTLAVGEASLCVSVRVFVCVWACVCVSVRVCDHTAWHASDIRNEPNDEETVARDMSDQMRWLGLMQPRWSLLKFRLPWTPGTTPYVEGDVYLQPYSATQSTETRLRVARGARVAEWDNQDYWERCFWFNTGPRVAGYDVEPARFGRSWDVAAEVAVLRKYRAAVWGARGADEDGSTVAGLVDDITVALGWCGGRSWKQHVLATTRL